LEQAQRAVRGSTVDHNVFNLSPIRLSADALERIGEKNRLIE
jgi:hypothetical protein